MADRSYGIEPGSLVSATSPTRMPNRRPVQNVSVSQDVVQQQFATQTQSDNPPPPPAHKSMISPTRSAFMGNDQPAIVANASELSAYQPVDGSRRALQGLDDLYSPRTRTPSPTRTPMQMRQSMARLSGYSTPSRPHSNPFTDTGAIPMVVHPAMRTPPYRMSTASPYRDTPEHRFSTPSLMHRNSSYQGDGYDDIDPTAIADDDDDYAMPPNARSRSKLGFAATTVPLPFGSRDNSGQYGPVSNAARSGRMPPQEKSAWLEDQEHGATRRKRILWIVGVLVLLAIVAGAVIGGIVASRSKTGSSSSSSSSSSSNGQLYDINSSQVQAVMNNNNLHKVFPAMDYTPLNAQYPECLSNPPDQNNITLDIAMLSQLTPAVRLYGTDCDQTEMVLTAIDKLQMNSSMSVWLGVWLGTNTTTNDRQLAQMYSILNKYPASHFAGIIVGNEVLYRKDLTLAQLSTQLSSVRSNLTAKGISLPVATSDLGDNWTAGLAATSDIVMANVHPFFAGVTPDVAPGWTWNFWQTHDIGFTTAKTGSWPKSIISEVGWPSDGGNDCGGAASCPSGTGAVASIDNMNKFMDGFVCQSMTNGTTYFWFEAFDEPWKVLYNTDTDQWESKWGLMDSNRNLKSGIKIPDCGGKTITKPY